MFSRVKKWFGKKGGGQSPGLEGLDCTQDAPRFLLVECRKRETPRNPIAPRHDAVAKLSHHDVPFRAR